MNFPKLVSRLYEELRRSNPRDFYSPAKRRRLAAWVLPAMPLSVGARIVLPVWFRFRSWLVSLPGRFRRWLRVRRTRKYASMAEARRAAYLHSLRRSK